MVLSDMPFEKSSLIHSRYNMLRRPDSAPIPREEDNKDKQSKEYAAFLREQERKVGPEGFLDSNRYSHTFVLKKEQEKWRASSERPRPTVVRMSTHHEIGKKDHDKRLKVIEDHMWQHKQEERELKRTEGDIIKNQRSVRHMLRDYENVINKKRLQEEKKLNQGLEKYTVLRRDYTHQTHDKSKARTHHNITFQHSEKDKGRRTELTTSNLARTYKAKMSEMELKQIEVDRINREYETKMRQKEEEKHRLKQELADLAIALNMEAQKGRTQSLEMSREKQKEMSSRITEDVTAKQSVENKIAKSDGESKLAEMGKRKLSADLNLTKAHIAIKQRDAQRHLTDTQMRLGGNSNVQNQLNEAAFNADMDLKTKLMQQNIETHNNRRVHLLTSTMKQKKETDEAKQQLWEERFKKRAAEQAKREHEDSLKFFQKMVTKGEDSEQNLYGQVRNAEYSRQKQEQSVKRLQQQLAEVKRRNAQVVRKELSERSRQEMELEQLLLKEKAELDKVHAQREERYIRLQNHRRKMQEDKHNLEKHEGEHLRLQRIYSPKTPRIECN